MTKYSFLDRNVSIFSKDLIKYDDQLSDLIKGSNVLVIGAAGTIGQSVFKEIISRKPKKIFAVDISENNLVELVRSVRSSYLNIKTEIKTFAIDAGSLEFKYFLRSYKPFDYVLNLSALKHVRSEKDPFTLMRLIKVNIFNTLNILKELDPKVLKKYFVVSTDKATNPVNMMGASKRIMEKLLFQESENFEVSLARFANVAFSDGSLLHGFNQRIQKEQPISAPNDVERYFISQKESGELCMLSTFLGLNRDIFFPKVEGEIELVKFSDIAESYLNTMGFEPFECDSEEEAIKSAKKLISMKKWPCYFFKSETTGEKDFEEFFSADSDLDLDKFATVGVIKNKSEPHDNNLNSFFKKIDNLYKNGAWSKDELVDCFNEVLDDFSHLEKGKNLDEKM